MELWLPPSARPDAEQRTGKCRICKAPLLPSEAARHVNQCYARNEAEVRESSLKHKAPNLLGDGGVDVEYEQYWKDRGTWRRS